LLGDELVQTPAGSGNNQPAVNTQSNHDLLAEIFGSSSSTPAPAPVSQRKAAVDDIMGLFGGPGVTSPAPQTPFPSAVPPVTPSVFTPAQAASPPTAPVPPQQKLTSYPAYDKNDLKITLTPQTSPAKPGVVMILARFQVTGGEAATGLSFQAAVPKVG